MSSTVPNDDHHTYLTIEGLRSSNDSSLKNVKTIAFLRGNKLHGFLRDRNEKLSVSEESIDVELRHLPPLKYDNYRPYLFFSTISVVNGAKVLTAKLVKEITVDPWDYHVANVKVSKLFNQFSAPEK